MSGDAKNAPDIDVNDLIIEKDTGARSPSGIAGKILTGAALAWALFQLWIVSPLQFELGIFILNDTESRSIHLAFATFLAFTAYPMFSTSPRFRIPIQDWIMALVAAFCSGYLFLFYDQLAMRPGLPTDLDIYVAIAGLVLLLEAARRSLGLPLMVIAILFLCYVIFGSASWMPDLVAHKGASLSKLANHMWLSTEGVFGIALGVSSGFVFLFVLFGSLLDKAGAGNYFIKVAFSLLGHLRGGPAKAAVLSSMLTGFISGSSIANVVTTGTFTIPLMKRVGFSNEKAGAVEVSGSVNGQIMPPVMGAAAFIMMEFIGISLQEVIRHAFLPAVISYIALLYMVHLEALKADMKALSKPVTRTISQRLIGTGIIVSSIIILCGIVYYGMGWIKDVAGDGTPYIVSVAIVAAYVMMIRFASQYPDLEPDDPDSPVVELPETGPTVKTGLHYLLPVVVLVWCLMIERLSPGLSAFWACMVMVFILVTQKPLLVFFRKQDQYKEAVMSGLCDLKDGLIAGSRNMIGIGVATAAAGIIVGTVSLTGIGQVMTQIVEVLSGGSLIMVLVLTAIISLILGMGLPTTANYIVVASIMVGVVQELGIQHGLLVPAIAVHLFVFYFGIMADVTPPVGLASFAAAAISKGDPIKTGLQAFLYSTRTAILPFFFIFNNRLLLIDVHHWWEIVQVFLVATSGLLLFSAATQGYFIARSRLYESAMLLIVATMLFVPGRWMDIVIPSEKEVPATEMASALEHIPAGELAKVYVMGEDDLGDPRPYHTVIAVPEGKDGAEKIKNMGLYLTYTDRGTALIDDMDFSSPAEDAGIDFNDELQTIFMPMDRPAREWVFVPAGVLLLIVVVLQRRRVKAESV